MVQAEEAAAVNVSDSTGALLHDLDRLVDHHQPGTFAEERGVPAIGLLPLELNYLGVGDRRLASLPEVKALAGLLAAGALLHELGK